MGEDEYKPTPAAGHPDGALIALCAQHIATLDALNAVRDKLDDDPLWTAYERTRDAISDAAPTTMAGMLAIAKAAVREAREPNGELLPDSTAGHDWAWSLTLALLRLDGGA